MFRKLALSAATVALAISSVAVSAAEPAAAKGSAAMKLSVLSSTAKVKRAGTPVSSAENIGGGSTLWILLGVIAAGVGIFLIADGDDTPSSP